jgi:hypothetical protein
MSGTVTVPLRSRFSADFSRRRHPGVRPHFPIAQDGPIRGVHGGVCPLHRDWAVVSAIWDESPLRSILRTPARLAGFRSSAKLEPPVSESPARDPEREPASCCVRIGLNQYERIFVSGGCYDPITSAMIAKLRMEKSSAAVKAALNWPY